MTQQQFDKLPKGTTLYFVSIDATNPTQIEIDHIKKGHTEPKSSLGLSLVPMLSSTKQGAIASAIENYTKQVAYHTTALSSVTELMKKYI